MCFIYYFEGNRVYGEIAKHLFTQLQKNRLKAATSVLTLAEILTFERLQKNKILFEKTKAKFHSIPNLKLYVVNEVISEACAFFRYKYSFTLGDALQLATSVVSSQEAFLSNDRRFKKVKEIDVVILNDFT